MWIVATQKLYKLSQPLKINRKYRDPGHYVTCFTKLVLYHLYLKKIMKVKLFLEEDEDEDDII